MSDTEEVPQQDQVAEKEASGSPVIPTVPKDEVAADAAPLTKKSPAKSSAKPPVKSPAKSPSKSPKKPVEKSSPAKSAKQSPAKSPKKAKKDESEEEDEDDEEEEEKKGVLDMPLVIEGKRKRESTSFLKVEENVSHKHVAPTVAGSGTALGDIPFIAHQIESEKAQELRPLYRACYKSMGKLHTLKKELRKFNGFSFAKDSDEYKKKSVLVAKCTRADLTHIRRILGLAVCKNKEEEVEVIMEFLVKPHDEGKKVPQKAAKRKSSAKAKTPSKKSKKDKESPKKKKVTSKEKVDTDSDEEEEDKSSDESEKEEEQEEEKEVKTPKKTPAKRKAVEKKTKTPSKKAKKVDSDDEEDTKEADDQSVSSSSDSSEKKDEKSEVSPTDKEVKAKITELLKTFDLTSVSMKQMVTAVCAAFPDHPQLSERTASIKTFIKDAIKEEE